MALSFITQFAQDADINTQIENNLSPEAQQQIQDQLNTVTTTNIDSQTATGLALFGSAMLLFYFVILAFFIICSIKIFTKAGRKWWEAIIPIYNVYVLLKIIGRPGWWLLLFFVPIVNFVISIIVSIDLAKAFKKDAVFGVVLLWLFSIIGWPMLAFGSAQYAGPLATGGSAEGNDQPQSPTPPQNNAPQDTPPAQPNQTPPAAPTPPANLVQ